MCMFCAAIPATLAVGSAVQSKQREAQRAAQARGEPLPRPRLPMGKLTAGVFVALVAASVTYHTHFQV